MKDTLILIAGLIIVLQSFGIMNLYAHIDYLERKMKKGMEKNTLNKKQLTNTKEVIKNV